MNEFNGMKSQLVLDLVIWLLWETPTTLMPDELQVQKYIDELKLRADIDTPEIQQAIIACHDFLNG